MSEFNPIHIDLLSEDAGAWGFGVGNALFKSAFADQRLSAQIDTLYRIGGVTLMA